MERRTLRDAVREQPDTFVLPLAIIALVVLWAAGAGKELWFDERFVQVISSQPISRMFELLKFENNPPLTFLLTSAWQRLFDSGEVALRTLSLLPTIGFLFALRHLARLTIGRVGAAIAMLLGAISGSVITQATELRMYPWLMLWSTLALSLSLQYQQTKRMGTLAVLSLVNLLGLYTHYTYVLVFIFLGAWLLWHERRRLWPIVVSFGLAAALFAPWYVVSISTKVQDLQTNIGLQRLAGDRWEAILLPIRFIIPPWFLDSSTWKVLRVLASSIIALGLVSALFRFRIRVPTLSPPLVLLSFIATIGVALAAFGFVAPKYGSVLIGPVLVLLALGLVHFPSATNVRVTMIATITAVALSASFTLQRLPYVTYRAAADIVTRAESPGDRILVYPFNDEIAVRPYYHGRLNVRGFFPLKTPDDVSLNDIVRYNFRVILDSTNVERLQSYVEGAQRVWFFFDVPPTSGYWNADLIATWFERNGYKATVYRELFHNVPPLLIRFDRMTLQT